MTPGEAQDGRLLPTYERLPVEFDRGEGVYLHDHEGNRYLDALAGIAVNLLGYRHPALIEAGHEALDGIHHLSNLFEIPPQRELARRLSDLAAGTRAFFCNSGAEAVEAAIKFARKYSHRFGNDGRTILSAKNSFHGRTLGALSLNRSKSVYRREFPEIGKVHDVPFCDDRSCTAETCSCGFLSGERSQLRRLLDPERGAVDPDDVAYLIIEPVQGEGGLRYPSDAFAEEIATLCAEHDLHLVADEVQAGVGRTGEFWASDHYPYEPDVIAAGKGLRVGATLANSDVFPDQRGRLSSTWGGGDIVGALQGVLTLDVIEDENLLDNATERGAQFRETLREADPDGVVDVRGKGLLLGVECETKERRDAVMEAALQRGLLMLGCGYKTLRILPPLDVRDREIDLAVDLLAQAFEATA